MTELVKDYDDFLIWLFLVGSLINEYKALPKYWRAYTIKV